MRTAGGGERAGSAASGETVPDLVRTRWGVELTAPLLARFEEPGWSYEERVPRGCPACGGELHSLRRPYESQGRVYRYVAVVCPSCPAAYALADLGVKRYDKLMGRSGRESAPAPVPAANPDAAPGADDTWRMLLGPCPTGDKPGGLTITPIHASPGVTLRPGPGPARVITSNSASPASGWPADLPLPAEPEPRLLYWCKVTDPHWRPPAAAIDAAEDIRVIMPDGPDFDALRAHLADKGVPYRCARHWQEAEVVGTVNDVGGRTDLVAFPVRTGPLPAAPVAGPGAHAARDAFALQWDALDALAEDADDAYVPVTDLVPQGWARFLKYPTFNPAQADAVPAVIEDDGNVVVVAPTGAGKTPIGMVAALKANAQGRKAAWLVPQRSLTDELDRELDLWRDNGLSVVRLTGEYAVDAELIRKADIWIATTEKFEAICRTGSLRDALADVGCLVVDEVHLLGDPGRGPILEALLARVGQDTGQVRIVGLSATVANADEVADWLGARLVRTTWRPTRLIWQIPVPAASTNSDRGARAAARTRAAARQVRAIADEGGSALVFCGSKRGVRMTALALAEERGAITKGVDKDDPEAVERLCSPTGVRLHYRDWPYKREAEKAFRSRAANALVATSTVAAGVNLPARAVVVRDTEIGLDRVEVSMVQQMFGRAGRVGAGEREGWAFLLTDGADRPEWQARLAAGYTVRSRIRERLPDHLLAEAVQGRVRTLREAEDWWTRTLSSYQGNESFDPLYDAVEFLIEARFLRRGPGPDPGPDPVPEPEDTLAATELGTLTSRFMLATDLADDLSDALRAAPVPRDPDAAEHLLTVLLAAHLPNLQQAQFTDRARATLLRVLHDGGHLDPPGTESDDAPARPVDEPVTPGDLARAALLLVAHSPQVFRTRSPYVLGIPAESLTGIYEESQRYLAWLGAQGPLGTAHPWAAVVAADLAARIRWRELGPRRGSGRLLWMCEQMATAPLAARLVPRMWRAARTRGIGAPDWPGTTPPTGCALPDQRYRQLLAERTTGALLTPGPDGVLVRGCPRGATVQLWDGTSVESHPPEHSPVDIPYPRPAPDDPQLGHRGAAVFTRGDRCATGWLSAYNGLD
ncbi:DEAD/DEAH box helicase [Streptomyces alfalfae]|uniref:DEAD/DEAH box helicase n=1 Tax=Streptomyces alfalfae TaxID=1642299 RepID=UPI0009A1CCC7|nr:DEAD/DEAH box helicase [Streptomyces alfalfae]AYA20066.1 DEAD/DEAH box helicase [Streptomyces fradiae]RXX43558.1 DEAD/DEAH box helicase [Streptomyces alfalfae]RZN01467.1 DEAD/DEAH box helicase [Streptomyces alfalfae]